MTSSNSNLYQWKTHEESLYAPFFQAPMPRPELTRAEFCISGKNLFKDFSLVQVSDLHYRPAFFGSHIKWLEQLVERIEALRADFFIFTGDAYCRNQFRQAKNVADIFKSINPAVAKIAIPGNGDLYRLNHFRESFEAAGFTVLIDTALDCPESGVNFVGSNYHIDYPIKALLELRKKNRLNFFLCHSPDIAWHLPKSCFDLTLCGHTHGGQIRIPGGRALATNLDFPDKFNLATGGYKIVKKNPFYVNRGIGFSYLPFRVFCPAELLYLEVKN